MECILIIIFKGNKLSFDDLLLIYLYRQEPIKVSVPSRRIAKNNASLVKSFHRKKEQKATKTNKPKKNLLLRAVCAEPL